MAKSKLKQNHFTQEQINQASNISIVDYIQVNSIGDLTRQSDHFYRLHFEGHDSIVIDTKKNYFVHNAYQGQKNAQGNLLNFIQYIHHNQIGFKEAMKEALTFIEKGYEPTQMDLKNEKDPFLYDYQIDSNTHIIQDYLTRRGIDKGLIQTLIAQHYLTQTKGGVLIANWTQDGRPPQAVEDVIGASEQPTHKSRQQYKSIKKNSKSHYGFNIRYGEVIEDVYVFEATIDLLSYLTLYPEKKQNAHFLSLEGVKHKTLYTFLKENHADHAPSCQIHIATDNDVAGIEFLDHLMVFKDQFQVVNEIPFYDSFSKNQYRQIMKWQGQQPAEKQLPLPITLSFLMLERPYLIKKYEQKDYQTDQAKYFLDGIPQGLAKLRDAFYSKENNQVAEQLIENSGYTKPQQKRLLALLKKARARELTMVERIYKDWNDYLLNPSNPIETKQVQEVFQNQRESEVSQDKEVQALIHQIVQKEEGYYLWHDHELEQLGASLDVMEDFHSRLHTIRYLQDGIHLYIEPSANEGATGYLSLEGHVLDFEGIQDYLSDHHLKGEDALQFLTALEKGIGKTWEKATCHYDQVLETVVAEYQLKEKALEKTQEHEKKAEGTIDLSSNRFASQPFNRSNFGKGSLQQEVEGSTTPVSTNDTSGRSVTSRSTLSYFPLYFTTNNEKIQTNNSQYRIASSKDIQRLNQYAPSIQATAQWYVETLSDSKIHYIFKNGDSLENLEVSFRKDNFLHLTGIKPIQLGKTASDFVDDFIYGNGKYDNITVSYAFRDKLQVLPMLSDIIDSQAFLLNDLSSVEKLNKLDLSSAIKTKDEDLLLLFKDLGNVMIPASLMRLKGSLKSSINSLQEKEILGIYRERSGIIEQISIHPDYQDKGQILLEALQTKQYEVIQEERSFISSDYSENMSRKKPLSFIQNMMPLDDKDTAKFIKETHLSPDLVEMFTQKGFIQKDKNGEIVFIWKKNGEVIDANYLGKNESLMGSRQDSFIFTVGKPRHLLLFDSPIDALSFLDLNRDIQNTAFISANPQNLDYFSQKMTQYIQHTTIDSIGDCLIKEKLEDNHLLKLIIDRKITIGHELISYQKYQPIEKSWTLDLKTVSNIKELNRNKHIQTSKEISKINELLR